MKQLTIEELRQIEEIDLREFGSLPERAFFLKKYFDKLYEYFKFPESNNPCADIDDHTGVQRDSASHPATSRYAECTLYLCG